MENRPNSLRRDYSNYTPIAVVGRPVDLAAVRAVQSNVSPSTSLTRTVGSSAENFFTDFSAPAPTSSKSRVALPPDKQIKRSSIVRDELVAELPHFDLPKYVAPRRSLQIVRKRIAWAKTILRGSLLVGSLGMLAAGIFFWRGYSSVQTVFRGEATVAALSSENVAPEKLKGEGDGRVNVLLMGVGGDGHDGGDLTDTMVVLSVDPVNNKAAMLSVPRDLWVKMPNDYFGSRQKINAAYSSGKYSYLGKPDLSNADPRAVEAGFESVDKVVSEVLGININYHVLVDFTAFKQAVDTLNGVEINVSEELRDPTMAWENANNPVLASVGLQTMDGKQALMYARSRETSSDFARSERQRQILLALKQKTVSLGTLSNPAKVDGLLSAFQDNIHTDLSAKAATRLYGIMKKISDQNVASLSLTEPQQLVVPDMVGGASVVRPVAGLDTYSAVQTYVRGQLPDGYLLKERAGVYVVGSSDAARDQAVSTLGDYGYHISGKATVPDLELNASNGTHLVDLSKGRAPYTLHYLEDRYRTGASKSLPANVQVPVGAQFVIITGI